MTPDIVKEALECFEECAEHESVNRSAALDDLKFARLSEQWPEKVKAQREKENRPALTINRLAPIIRQVVNDGRQNRPQIKVQPVDSKADPQTAKILNGLIKNIEQQSNADVAYDTGLDFAASCGFGFWRVNVDYSEDDFSFDKDIIITRIANPFAVYGDHRSQQFDSSDWNYAFVVDDMPLDAFRREWKGAEPKNWIDDYEGISSDWRGDKTVRVAEYWVRDDELETILKLSDGTVVSKAAFEANRDTFQMLGIQVVAERKVRSKKVTQYILTGAEALETNPWAGKYIPIVPVYGEEVNVEGKRYFRSAIRDAKDPQTMFNFWRSATTELVALAPKAPYIGPRGAFNTDQEKWSSANTKSHAFIEYDGGVPPQRQEFAGPPAGALQEALNAADDIRQVTGIHEAGMGMPSNETSGKAILARQREGDVSTFHFLDNLNRAIRHTGKIILDLIPHVYTGERVIRVMGGEAFDQPMTVNTGPQQQQAEDGSIQIYDLTAGKYDVAIDSGPSFTTRREESANQMIELIRAFPEAASVLGDLLAKNLDWPGAEEIAQRMQALLPPAIKGQDPAVAQLQQQNQQLQSLAESLQKQMESALLDKRIDAEKVRIDGYNAETNRLKVTSAAMTPEQIQVMIYQTIGQLINSPDVLVPGQQPGDPMATQMRPPQMPEMMQQTPGMGGMPPPQVNPGTQ